MAVGGDRAGWFGVWRVTKTESGCIDFKMNFVKV